MPGASIHHPGEQLIRLLQIQALVAHLQVAIKQKKQLKL